jgi:hypothetical protein
MHEGGAGEPFRSEGFPVLERLRPCHVGTALRRDARGHLSREDKPKGL